MRRLPWQRRGILQPLLIGAATLSVFVLGKLWPNYEFGLWMAFLIVIGVYLYLELREPVNYSSIAISEDAIEYAAMGQRDVIRLDEICKVQLVRERAAFDSGIESKWIVHTLSGRRIELMDEWTHRKQLLRTFRERLSGFDLAAARSGLRAWREGVWPCFDRAN
jgi:hypothetical protein